MLVLIYRDDLKELEKLVDPDMDYEIGSNVNNNDASNNADEDSAGENASTATPAARFKAQCLEETRHALPTARESRQQGVRHIF